MLDILFDEIQDLGADSALCALLADNRSIKLRAAMGVNFRATCDCGYVGSANCGSSRAEHGRVFQFPHLCRQCREVVGADRLEPTPRCPTCGATGADLTLYGTAVTNETKPLPSAWQMFKRWLSNGWRQVRVGTASDQLEHVVNSEFCYRQHKTYTIKSEAYECPKCGLKGLRFAVDAHFD